MRSRPTRRVAVLVLAVLAPALARGADQPPAKDSAGDPLPPGAKLRIGNSRLALSEPVVRHPFVLLGPDYKTFLQVREAGPMLRLDAATGAPVGKAPEIDRVNPGRTLVAVSGDGRRVATALQGKISVRATETGELVKALKGPPAAAVEFSCLSLSISADGKTLAAGGTRDRKPEVVVWDVESGDVVFQAEPLHPSPGVVLSPDGKLFAVRGGQGFVGRNREEIQLWSVAQKKELFRVRPTTSGNLAPAMAFSPDGATFALSYGEGLIDLWDVKTGDPYEPLLGRKTQGAHLAFSPDGKTLAAVSADGAIDRWTVAGGKHLGTTEWPVQDPRLGSVDGIGFADNTRVVGWGRHTRSLVVWEVPSARPEGLAPAGKLITPPPELTQPVDDLVFAAGGKELITSAPAGRGLSRWDVATGKPLGSVNLRFGRNAGFGPILLAPDGARAVQSLSVFDLVTGAEEFAIPRPFATTAQAPAADLKRLGVLMWGGPAAIGKQPEPRVVVWDLVARRKVAEAELPGVFAGAAGALSPSGTRLVTFPSRGLGARGQTIAGWDLKTGKKLGQVDLEQLVAGLSVTVVDDTTAFVRYPTGRLRVLDYEAGKFGAEIEPDAKAGVPVAPVVPGATPTSAAVFSPDRKRFAAPVAAGAGRWSHGVRVYEWPTGKPVATLAGHTAPVSAIAFTPDGKSLATASKDMTVVVWDMTAAET